MIPISIIVRAKSIRTIQNKVTVSIEFNNQLATICLKNSDWMTGMSSHSQYIFTRVCIEFVLYIAILGRIILYYRLSSILVYCDFCAHLKSSARGLHPNKYSMIISIVDQNLQKKNIHRKTVINFHKNDKIIRMF